jgi:hypothetical protein
LRYLAKKYGDEVDIGWRLRLCSRKGTDEDTNEDASYLQISTSGGLPRSKFTWSAAMTFCHEFEAVESVGRATDWGSGIWDANEVCKSFRHGYIFAEGEMSVFAKRSGESSFSWPFLTKGSIGAVYRLANKYDETGRRDFRAGEVVVPRNVPGELKVEKLKQQFIYPGIDYRNDND